ncbi:citrate lyase holo-[acyl-carrier protein] synthase [Amphibacillus cookii]|uniref:citrate lyase holo-[acyl-carrier protein] synthase n=1 Tax=Amphibacillus cookii TaxID=767787 RepID=UPI0019581D63|nr:citrate lyase holo-[acyl-carrier protein] synthase [Amphibacillus cookii]MBM7540203.1 holo-ACP synthase CitX [Amphibacillus cookii]
MFSNEGSQSLKAILARREERSILINHLLDQYGISVISIKLNIPGAIKNNPMLIELFDTSIAALKAVLKTSSKMIDEYNQRDLSTGPEYHGVICSLSPKEIKKRTIHFEETTSFGRLLDVDVIDPITYRSISRTELGYAMRKCYLCDQEAKVCARAQSHPIKDLYKEIEKIIKEM